MNPLPAARARRIVLALLLSLIASTGQAGPTFDTGGLLFGDLYYLPSDHLPSGDGAAGAWLRRGYLTFNADFDEHWFGRLRFELNQSGQFETYTFKGQTKDLFLGRRLGGHKLLLGLSSTPTFDLVESAWGMRYIARTPMDLQGVPSRDTGLAANGPIAVSENWRYRAMYGAPVTFGSDKDANSRWMGAVTWLPAPGWTADFYADYEAMDGPHDRTTVQGFLAWQGEAMRWGLLYANQDRQADPPLELASLYLVRQYAGQRAWFLRADRLIKPSPKGNGIAYLPMDPSASATMFFGGLEFRPSEHFSWSPNVVVTYYDHNDEGVRPETDVYLRLTLLLNYE